MIYTRTSFLVKKLYYSLIWDFNDGSPSLYLTFDDGPTPGITPAVLDLLDQYQTKATFFCLGRNVERFPDIFREIQARGHSTGNHTYSHLKGWKSRNQQYYDDIELAEKLIPSRLFRPPYGQIKRSQIKYLSQKFKIVMWDVMAWDFDQNKSKEDCYSIIKNLTRPGSIIVLHDSVKASKNMLYVLPRVLEDFSKKSFSFKKIEI